MKKIVLASVGGFIAMFTLSALWHMFATNKFYPPNPFMGNTGETAMPNLWYIGAGYLVLAILMTILYSKFQGDEKPLKKGAMFGVLIGALFTIPWGLILISVVNYPIMAAVYDGIWGLIEQGIGGIVIAYLYSMK